MPWYVLNNMIYDMMIEKINTNKIVKRIFLKLYLKNGGPNIWWINQNFIYKNRGSKLQLNNFFNWKKFL